MTEEIIIDGVDVSKCEYFNAKYEGCHCYNTKEEYYAINPNEHHSCKGVNCYYKKDKDRIDKYKQALDEIEEYINSFPDFVKEADKIILDIINKAKDGE